MPFLRNLVHDLVEKRLWPVAILLAAALVAVPMLLKSDPEAASAPATSPAARAPAGTAEVLDAVALAKPERTRLRLGGRRNPFQEPGGGSSASKGDATNADPPLGGLQAITDEPTGGDLGSSDRGSPDGGTVPPDTTGPPSSEDKEQPTGIPTWTLDVYFGPVEELAELTAIQPGTGIPSNDEPLLIFVGSIDGKTATFLPSSDAVPLPEGDGTCSPSARACNELKLKPGQTAVFDVATDSGTKQYVLEVSKLVKRPL
ncbi:MAG: hypothetical protein ACR2ML_00655 [Solirubrobacteraceae bacterium]